MRVTLSGGLLGVLLALSCSDAKHSSPPLGDVGGSTAGRPPRAGSGGHENSGGAADAGGNDSSSAGQQASGKAGEDGSDAGQGGSSAGSGSVEQPQGGAGPDPIPPVGDPPVCQQGRTFGNPTKLDLSGAGDDVLQAITPDELTIAWKNGEHFYVADRDDTSSAFGTPQEVAASAQYNSVALGADGLLLVATRKDLRVVEQPRGAGEAFSNANPDAGSFQDFDNTLATIPLGNQVLVDAVLSADETSFFFSHFVSSEAGNRISVHESRRPNGPWAFSGPDLGEILYANGVKRRIPTGVSSDLLTLFYRDEVSGDFRAAWRVNTQVQFNHAEPLALGNGTQAAAPNAACTKLYFSAQGQSDLDLFVSTAN